MPLEPGAARPDRSSHGTPPWGVVALVLVAIGLTAAHVLSQLEGSSWASPLLAVDHLFDLALALVILLYGLALGRVAGAPLLELTDDPLAEGLAATVLGLGLIASGTLALGLAHLFYGPVALAILAALTAWLRTELAGILRGAATGVRAWMRAGAPSAPTIGQRLVLLVLALTAGALLIEATIWPGWGSPIEWDAPAYHLSAPRLYLAAHRFVPLPDIPLANAPSGQEMLLTVGLLAGSEGVGKMLHLLAAIGMAASTFTLARRLFGVRAAWLSVFLLFTVLWLWVEIPATLPDFTAVCALLLGVADLLDWVQRYGPRSPAPGAGGLMRDARAALRRDRLLIRAGLLIGVALSFKLTNLPALPAAVGTLGISALAIGGPGPRSRVLLAARSTATLVAAALAPLAPWLLKNLAFFRDPLYPLAVRTATPSQSNTLPGAVAGHSQSRLWGLIGNAGEIGWHTLGPLSLLLLLVPFALRRRAGRALLVFLVLAMALWLLFVPAFKEPRYYVPVIAIADVAIAGVLAPLLARCERAIAGRMRRTPARQPIAELPLVAYLLLQSLLGLGIAVTQVVNNDATAVAVGAVSRDAYLGTRVRPYQAEQWANAHLPRTSTIAMLGVTRGYYLDAPYLAEWYNTRLGRLQDPAGRRAEFAAWCRVGVTHAILDRGDDTLDGGPDINIRPARAFPWLRAPGLDARVLYSAHGVDVLTVRPCGIEGA